MRLKFYVFETERIMYDTDPTAKGTIILHLFDYILFSKLFTTSIQRFMMPKLLLRNTIIHTPCYFISCEEQVSLANMSSVPLHLTFAPIVFL